MLNKLVSFICVNSDFEEVIIFDIVGLFVEKFFFFGRLDKDIEGFLILSNDG